MRSRCDSWIRRIGESQGCLFLKSIHDGKLEWIERYITYACTEILSSRSGIFEVLPYQFHTPC